MEGSGAVGRVAVGRGAADELAELVDGLVDGQGARVEVAMDARWGVEPRAVWLIGPDGRRIRLPWWAVEFVYDARDGLETAVIRVPATEAAT